MLVSAQIIDGNNGTPLPGATISIDGIAVAQSDSKGNFSFDTTGTNAVISYVGYAPASISVYSLAGTGQLYLYPSTTDLPIVTVVANTVKKNPLPFAAGLGALIFIMQKKKRVSGIDTSTLLLVGGGLLAAYFIMSKPAAPVVATPVYTPQQLLNNSGNSTASIISASGSAVSNILTAFSNF